MVKGGRGTLNTVNLGTNINTNTIGLSEWRPKGEKESYLDLREVL